MEAPTKPSAVLLACAVFVIAVCLFLISVLLAAFTQAWAPCSVIAGIVLLPVLLVLAINQYLAVFRRRAKSATIAAVILFIVAGFAGFAFVTTIGEMVMDGIDPYWYYLLLPMIAIGAASALAGWMNLRWREKIKASTSGSPAEPGETQRFQFSLRELLAGVAVVAVLTSITTYFAKSALPRYAEHVDPSRAPSGIPDGATDISFCHGYRGTIAYEFTIDERGFRDWVNSGIGSLECQAAGVQIRPIQGPHTIRRYYCLTSKLTGPREAIVTQGLYYSWSKEDRGVHAVFDSSTNRAYYFAHFH